MQYQQFTPEMRKTHTILVPNMLPIHFRLLISIFGQFGYHMELLESSSRTVVEEGLKNVHNDTCYPALLVVGQFIEALKSGKYDPNKTALLITQTGGGCRASNYIHLLRKCVAQQFPQVPVISLNFAGLEKASGFQLTLPLCIKLVYGVLYADLLMTIYNQCRPYELNEGESQKTLEQWQNKLDKLFRTNDYRHTKKWYRAMLEDFAAIPRSQKPKIRVGIIGEIYVKYSPLANNHLEDFLLQEGCEPVVPTLMSFVLYCAANSEIMRNSINTATCIPHCLALATSSYTASRWKPSVVCRSMAYLRPCMTLKNCGKRRTNIPIKASVWAKAG